MAGAGPKLWQRQDAWTMNVNAGARVQGRYGPLAAAGRACRPRCWAQPFWWCAPPSAAGYGIPVQVRSLPASPEWKVYIMYLMRSTITGFRGVIGRNAGFSGDRTRRHGPDDPARPSSSAAILRRKALHCFENRLNAERTAAKLYDLARVL
jgi:hypothetical protein